MAESRVLYTGNGVTQNFAVTFPFISRDHVKVYRNNALQLLPLDYVWVDDSTIRFPSAPPQDTAVLIKRETPYNQRLVDFQNGAVLTEADLDLSATQLFYMTQEVRENYSDLVDNEIIRIGLGTGIGSTDPATIISNLVSSILNDELAADLQAAITDINTNGETILDVIDQLSLLGSSNAARTAFALDTTKVHIDDLGGDTFATRLAALAAADGSNAAAIVTEQTARASADTALASDITALTTTVNGNTATITTLAQSVNGLEARYGVSLNVNGYITGFTQFNDGNSGTFAIMADNFYIVDPAAGGQNPKAVFAVSGGVVTMQNVLIDNAVIGSLSVGKLTQGTLNADIDVGTGRIVWSNGVYMKVAGIGFGTSNQFIEWFGPSMDIALCSEANAISYLKTNGDAYFGGSLHAGTLSTAGTTTSTSGAASITIGPFGTNGNPIAINYSYTYSDFWVTTTDDGVPATPTATLILEQNIGGGGWVTVATKNVTGSAWQTDLGEGAYEYGQAMSDAWAYTDNVGGTWNREYRLSLTARSVVGNTIETQKLSIISTEE